MTDTVYYSPAETAERLGIASSTLRKLALRFPDQLSDLANPAGDKGHRRYTAQDIATLRHILDLKRRGVPDEEIPDQLAIEPPPEPVERIETPQNDQERGITLAPFVALAQAQQGSIEDVQARLRQMEQEIAELRVQIARLEMALHDHPGIVPKRPIRLNG